jgi:hypothetical protein
MVFLYGRAGRLTAKKRRFLARAVKDTDEGDGGLVVVPGSHKSNMSPPRGVFAQAGDFESELAFPVHNPGAKAGGLGRHCRFG